MIEAIELTQDNLDLLISRCRNIYTKTRYSYERVELEFINYLGNWTKLHQGQYLVVTDAGAMKFISASQVNRVFTNINWIK